MRRRAWAAAALILLPQPALAHAPLAGASEFYAGLAHPLTDPAAILTLLGVALLAGQTGGERGVWAALAGVAACLAGALTAARGFVPMADPAALQPAINVAVALVAAASLQLRPTVLLGMAAIAGSVLGFEQGSEVASPAFAGGVTLAVALALLYGVSLIDRLPAGWPRLGVRVTGAWLVAIQALMLGLALR